MIIKRKLFAFNPTVAFGAMNGISTASELKQGYDTNKALQKEITAQKADFNVQIKNQAVAGQQKINQTMQAAAAKTGAIKSIMK